jgi:hypothetical protein
MSRVKRRLLQFVFVVSLLLTVATGALFIRGLWRSDHFNFDRMHPRGADSVTEHLELHFTAAEWSFLWQQLTETGAASVYNPFELPLEMRHDVSHPWPPLTKGTFDYEHSVDSNDSGRLAAAAGSVPVWCVLLIVASLNGTTGIALWRGRRRTRAIRGECPTCAYDLRGAAHERCPECGEAVAADAAQPAPAVKRRAV